MTNKPTVKKNISSMQVLKTLQLLLEDNYTMSELVEKLNKNEKTEIFNNSVVSKYINTCRACGIEIPKFHNKYYVANLPFGMDLSLRELDLLKVLQYTTDENLPKRSRIALDKFIHKLNKYSNKKIVRVENKTASLTRESFDIAILENRKIKLMFKTKATLECYPIGIVESSGKTYFRVETEKKEKLIAINRITGLELLNHRETPIQNNKKEITVVYKLKGDLAQRYSIRENEKIINRKKDELVVSNIGEDKEILFSRLLRYDSLCEIEYPKSYREEMKQITNDILKNYGL